MRVYTPREVLFASSYCVAKDLCDEQRFEKNIVGPLEELRVLGGDGLFTAHNHEHNWERTLVCYVTSEKSESAAFARGNAIKPGSARRLRVELQLTVSQWLIDC